LYLKNNNLLGFDNFLKISGESIARLPLHACKPDVNHPIFVSVALFSMTFPE